MKKETYERKRKARQCSICKNETHEHYRNLNDDVICQYCYVDIMQHLVSIDID